MDDKITGCIVIHLIEIQCFFYFFKSYCIYNCLSVYQVYFAKCFLSCSMASKKKLTKEGWNQKNKTRIISLMLSRIEREKGERIRRSKKWLLRSKRKTMQKKRRRNNWLLLLNNSLYYSRNNTLYSLI